MTARNEIIIAKHGTRSMRRSEVYLNYSIYGIPDGPVQMDYFIWIIRGKDRTVIVDTGFSRHGAEQRGREVLADVTGLYDELRITPESAPDIVVTHGHYDHIGNLSHFPHSRVFMARSEFDFWTSGLGKRPLFHAAVEDDEIAHLTRIHGEGRLHLFDGQLDLAPGITVQEVGGHTPGQSVVFVDTADGTVLLASDAVHFYEELESDLPFSAVTDVVRMYAVLADIRDWVKSGRVRHLVTGHDPSTVTRFQTGPVPAISIHGGDS